MRARWWLRATELLCPERSCQLAAPSSAHCLACSFQEKSPDRHPAIGLPCSTADVSRHRPPFPPGAGPPRPTSVATPPSMDEARDGFPELDRLKELCTRLRGSTAPEASGELVLLGIKRGAVLPRSACSQPAGVALRPITLGADGGRLLGRRRAGWCRLGGSAGLRASLPRSVASAESLHLPVCRRVSW